MSIVELLQQWKCALFTCKHIPRQQYSTDCYKTCVKITVIKFLISWCFHFYITNNKFNNIGAFTTAALLFLLSLCHKCVYNSFTNYLACVQPFIPNFRAWCTRFTEQ